MEPATGNPDQMRRRLERWAAAARVDDAAGRRERERWLRHQAGEEGTLAGALVDLAEQGADVAVHLAGGRVHHGQVLAVAHDFVALRTGRHEAALVALDALAAVVGRGGGTLGDRGSPPLGVTLARALAGLAAERERVVVVARGGSPATAGGTLRSVGRDLVVVRTEAVEPGTAYFPLDAVGEVLLGG